MDSEPTRADVDFEAVERSLRAALRVEPSPEFLARVRTRMAEGPAPSGWTLSSIAALAGAVAVILMAAIVASRATRPPAMPVATIAGQPAPPAGPAADVELSRTPVLEPLPEPVERHVKPGPRPRAPRTDEGQALRDVLKAVDRGAIALPLPPVVRAGDDRSTTIPNLAIAPISISAVVVEPIAQ